MSYKYPAIDILKIMAKSEREEWNAWLRKRYELKDLEGLIAWRYGMNLGMAVCRKRGVVTDNPGDAWSQEIVNLWIRMTRSIEITAKRVIKERFPMPGAKENPDRFREVKKKRDLEIHRFMRESSP